MLNMRRFLQYLWLRGVHYRRIIDFIGATESSAQYQYIRKECGEEYSKMCRATPVSLKENGFVMVFRNIVMSPLYYERIFETLRQGKDIVMLQRVNETMKGPMVYLFFKVMSVWAIKLARDAKTKIARILRPVRRHNSGVDIETIRDMVKNADFNCILLLNKSEKIFSSLSSEMYQNFCRYGLKPLFILFGNNYLVSKKDKGNIVEIPFRFSIFPRYSLDDRSLLKGAISWISKSDAHWTLRRKVISDIRDNFPQYTYLRKIAAEILGSRKAKCVLMLTENRIEYRIFLHQAKDLNLPTLLYYPLDGIGELLYDKYYSDVILVSNGIQFRNFINLGYPPNRCTIIGSFNYPSSVDEPVKIPRRDSGKPHRILYFTKGTKSIDEWILDELIEKLKSLDADYSLIIKKHPKDPNSFRRFRNGRVLIKEKIDYIEFVEISDLIVSQYSGVINRIIPLRKPTILYTYSDILEYGERSFFQNVRLPNYLKYVQNKQEFHNAIECLLNMGEPDPLPQELAEGLYGYMDTNCGHRIAKIVKSLCHHSQIQDT